MVSGSFGILIGIGVVFVLITLYYTFKRPIDLEGILAANRNVGLISGSLSILATWIAPPAILIAGQVSYQMGLAGAFWFTVPNALTLVVFALFAADIKKRIPKGYTISQIFPHSEGKLYGTVATLTFFRSFIIFVQAVIGGAAFLTFFSDFSRTVAIGIILSILLSYSLLSGLSASIITDLIQMVILGVLFVVFVPWTVVTGDGITAFLQVLSVENVRSIFVPPGLYFGIIISISLFTAPFVNQFIWQRVFAIKESKLKQSFTLAGVLFFFIPFGISVLGFMAAMQSLAVENPVLAGYVPMAQYLPEVISTIVFVILATALLSTADSALVACASILAIDFGNTLLETGIDEVRMTRVSMIGVAVVVGLAALGPFNLLDWLLFNAAIGAVLIAPLLMSIYREQDLNPQRVFYGLALAILFSFPLFSYASLQNDNPLRILALIGGFLISTVPLLADFEPFKSLYKNHL